MISTKALGQIEAVEVKLNTNFMAMAQRAVDRFWMEVNEHGKALDVVNRIIAANYKAYGMEGPRDYLHPHWRERAKTLTFLPYGRDDDMIPATHPRFDRVPLANYGQELEAGLLAANRRFAKQMNFETTDDAIILVPLRDEPEFAALFTHLHRLDSERNRITNAAHIVIERCLNWPGPNSERLALAMAREALPILRHVTPPASQSWQMHLNDVSMAGVLEGIDMGAIMPALVRLENHYALTT